MSQHQYYRHLENIINHEANQNDDGGFFAQLGGIQPDHDDDGPPARGLFQNMNFNRNSYVYRTSIPQHVWPKMPNIIGQHPTWHKHQPLVKVRREVLSNSYGTLTRWNWRCNICGLGRAQSGWRVAMDTADQHARNHH